MAKIKHDLAAELHDLILLLIAEGKDQELFVDMRSFGQALHRAAAFCSQNPLEALPGCWKNCGSGEIMAAPGDGTLA